MTRCPGLKLNFLKQLQGIRVSRNLVNQEGKIMLTVRHSSRSAEPGRLSLPNGRTRRQQLILIRKTSLLKPFPCSCRDPERLVFIKTDVNSVNIYGHCGHVERACTGDQPTLVIATMPTASSGAGSQPTLVIDHAERVFQAREANHRATSPTSN